MAFLPGQGPVGGLPTLPEQPQPSNPLLALLQRLQSQQVAQPGIYEGLAPGGIHYFGPGGSGVIPEPHDHFNPGGPMIPGHPGHAHMPPPGLDPGDFEHLLRHPAVLRLLGRRVESRSSMAAHAARKAMAAHHANDPRLGY